MPHGAADTFCRVVRLLGILSCTCGLLWVFFSHGYGWFLGTQPGLLAWGRAVTQAFGSTTFSFLRLQPSSRVPLAGKTPVFPRLLEPTVLRVSALPAFAPKCWCYSAVWKFTCSESLPYLVTALLFSCKAFFSHSACGWGGTDSILSIQGWSWLGIWDHKFHLHLNEFGEWEHEQCQPGSVSPQTVPRATALFQWGHGLSDISTEENRFRRYRCVCLASLQDLGPMMQASNEASLSKVFHHLEPSWQIDGPRYLWVLHPWVQPTTNGKYLQKVLQFPKNQNLDFQQYHNESMNICKYSEYMHEYVHSLLYPCAISQVLNLPLVSVSEHYVSSVSYVVRPMMTVPVLKT